jgi:hypothetical protein
MEPIINRTYHKQNPKYNVNVTTDDQIAEWISYIVKNNFDVGFQASLI